ncbi:MAG TPA: hypothetical protein VGF44_18170, partial [Terriglobales bacterium]
MNGILALESNGMTTHANATLKTILESQRLRDYPDWAPDDYFEIFAAQQVLKKAKFNSDPDEIEGGLIGGDGDGGVDGFYLFCNRKLILEDTDIKVFSDQRLTIELVIVQAKHKGSFEESVPVKFHDFVDHCLAPERATASAKTLYSEALLEKVTQFRQLYELALPMSPTLSVDFYHAALSDTVDKKVMTRGELVTARFKKYFPAASSKCSYCPVIGSELITLHAKRPESKLTLKTPKFFDLNTFGGDAFTCVVTIGDFYNFITEDDEIREWLFEANVRDHAVDAKFNKGISETLHNP